MQRIARYSIDADAELRKAKKHRDGTILVVSIMSV